MSEKTLYSYQDESGFYGGTSRRRFLKYALHSGVGLVGVASTNLLYPSPSSAQARQLVGKLLKMVSKVGPRLVSGAAAITTLVGTIDAVKNVLKDVHAPDWLMHGDDNHTPAQSGLNHSLFKPKPFQPRKTDPHKGGIKWTPQIQQVAHNHGNSWVPRRNEGFVQTHTTGIWSSQPTPEYQYPTNPYSVDPYRYSVDPSYAEQVDWYTYLVNLHLGGFHEVYMRQFGPLIFMVACICGVPVLFGEGLYNPENGAVHWLGIGLAYEPSSPDGNKVPFIFSRWQAAGQLTEDWGLQGEKIFADPYGKRVPGILANPTSLDVDRVA